jgi:hypothetical protein
VFISNKLTVYCNTTILYYLFDHKLSQNKQQVELLKKKMTEQLLGTLATLDAAVAAKLPFPCGVNSDPFLDGYWGGDLHTISNQSVLLGT